MSFLLIIYVVPFLGYIYIIYTVRRNNQVFFPHYVKIVTISLTGRDYGVIFM